VAYSVYSGGGRVHYLAISRDGVATGEPRQVNDGARAKSEYAMATDGTDIGLVWTDGSANESSQDDEHNHDLYFARLSAEGEILTPAQRVTETGGLSISVYLAWRDGAWVAGKEPSYKKPVQLQRLTRCDDPSSN
jgi:hypothetical protein